MEFQAARESFETHIRQQLQRTHSQPKLSLPPGTQLPVAEVVKVCPSSHPFVFLSFLSLCPSAEESKQPAHEIPLETVTLLPSVLRILIPCGF